MESQLRESEEALQITALRSLQCEQAYQQCKVELEEYVLHLILLFSCFP